MCGVDKYDKERVPITDDASSDSIIPMTSKSFKESLNLLGQTIKAVEDWL